MPITLPSADSVFAQRPGLKPGRIASYDITGVAKGEVAAATGDVKELQGRAEGERGVAAGRQTEAQAHRLEGDTARIRGEAEMGFARGMGQNVMAEAKSIGEVGRSIAEADAKTANSIAGAGQKVGAAIENIYERERAKTSELELARANADLSSFRTRKSSELSKDLNPDGMSERYGKEADEHLDLVSRGFTDPRQQELFRLKAGAEMEAFKARVSDYEFGLRKQRTFDRDTERLNTARDEMLVETDPTERAKKIHNGKAIIDGWVATGYK